MTADRLDTAIRSANPGMDHPPAMSFEQLVQSIYSLPLSGKDGKTDSLEWRYLDWLGKGH